MLNDNEMEVGTIIEKCSAVAEDLAMFPLGAFEKGIKAADAGIEIWEKHKDRKIKRVRKRCPHVVLYKEYGLIRTSLPIANVAEKPNTYKCLICEKIIQNDEFGRAVDASIYYAEFPEKLLSVLIDMCPNCGISNLEDIEESAHPNSRTTYLLPIDAVSNEDVEKHMRKEEKEMTERYRLCPRVEYTQKQGGHWSACIYMHGGKDQVSPPWYHKDRNKALSMAWERAFATLEKARREGIFPNYADSQTISESKVESNK